MKKKMNGQKEENQGNKDKVKESNVKTTRKEKKKKKMNILSSEKEEKMLRDIKYIFAVGSRLSGSCSDKETCF